jgi:hypothetical protein
MEELRMTKLLAAVALILSASWADTLILRNGRTINGSYLGGDSRQVRMAVGDRIENYPVADIVRLEFGSIGTSDAAAPAQTAEMPPPPPPVDRDRDHGMRTDRTPPQPYSGGRGILIPAGSTLTVRMIDPVDSRNDRLGQTYRASLDEPLMVNGDVVVPRGVDVVAKLVDDQQSGRMTGKTILTLDLESITVDGRAVPISTEAVTRASGSKTKTTGLATGGVAALGAVIGGIAGGGRGAAIGAVSGAGAGAAGSVMMKGEQVKIPSETRLSFALQQPLKI